VAETPCVARSYCPGCEPAADPIGQVLVVLWCGAHTPARDGVDDAAVALGTNGSVTIEAGGSDNQRWCELIHGTSRKRLARRSAPRAR